MGEISAKIEIRSEDGLHARPAAQLVNAIKNLNCKVILSKEGEDEEINGKSILGVMMLAAEQGQVICARVDGPDAEKALEAIRRILQEDTGEIL